MRKLLLIPFVAALLLPAQAVAGDATIVARDLPLAGSGSRGLAAAAPKRFDLVGLHWQGRGAVQFRVRSVAGRWSAWESAAPEAEDRPDAQSGERAASGRWRLGNPWWVGPSNRLEVRTSGVVTRLRAYYVRSAPSFVPLRTIQKAGSPAIVPRSGWGADESIRRGTTAYAPELRVAIVHHTAGANGYSAAQSPAIVKAIQVYHVKGNGWNDIGYNFLVDRFGKVFEGRYGGIDRNVVGAHAEGFNTGSVGVAVIGEYTALGVAREAQDSLAKLLAWRLDVAHVNPLTTLSFISGGNPRFPSGVPVFLRAVSGHRDTGFTDCPGTALYSLLNGLAGTTQALGLPKLYSPLVSGKVPGKVRFRATLSSALPWTVNVTDAAGTVVAGTNGQGAAIDWTWDAAALPAGPYRYRIESAGATPVSGSLGAATAGGGVELTVSGIAADPETLSPNDDGQADASTLTYTLSDAATVTAVVRNELGEPVATIEKAWRKVGEHAITFAPATELPDGVYTVSFEAKGSGGRVATASIVVTVSRTLGSFAPAHPAFSPNGDGKLDTLAFSFVLAAPAEVRLRILRDGKWIATPFTGPLAAGPQRLEWDGTKRVGRVKDGTYDAVLEATDPIATSSLAVPFATDTARPSVKILQRTPLTLRLSEPGTLKLRVGGRTLTREATAAGTVKFGGIPRLGVLRVVAWDAAGNSSIPVSKR